MDYKAAISRFVKLFDFFYKGIRLTRDLFAGNNFDHKIHIKKSYTHSYYYYNILLSLKYIFIGKCTLIIMKLI